MTKVAKLIDSHGKEENTILVDDNYEVPAGYTITVVSSVQAVIKHPSLTHIQVIKKLPAGALKAITARSKTDEDVALWKYMFELAQEIDPTDADFQAGITVLKNLNILPADWSLF